MSAVNPVLLLPGALRDRGTALARGFVQSLTLGAGQFCTNPGLLIGIAGPALEAFAEAAGAAILNPVHAAIAGVREYTCADPEGHVWTFSAYAGE